VSERPSLLVLSLTSIAVGGVVLWLGGPAVAGQDGATVGITLLLLGVIGGFVTIMIWSVSSEGDRQLSGRTRSARLRRGPAGSE
jgi:hypothetical protein